jgi:hypothetical protein
MTSLHLKIPPILILKKNRVWKVALPNAVLFYIYLRINRGVAVAHSKMVCCYAIEQEAVHYLRQEAQPFLRQV